MERIEDLLFKPKDGVFNFVWESRCNTVLTEKEPDLNEVKRRVLTPRILLNDRNGLTYTIYVFQLLVSWCFLWYHNNLTLISSLRVPAEKTLSTAEKETKRYRHFQILSFLLKFNFWKLDFWILKLRSLWAESIGFGGIGDGERSGRGRRSDPNVGGADGGGEAHSVQMPGGERGLPQVQEEGLQPGEVSRPRSPSHALRPQLVSHLWLACFWFWYSHASILCGLLR